MTLETIYMKLAANVLDFWVETVETQFLGTAQDTVPFATMYEKVSHSVTGMAAEGAAFSPPYLMRVSTVFGGSNMILSHRSEFSKLDRSYPKDTGWTGRVRPGRQWNDKYHKLQIPSSLAKIMT